MNEIWQECFSLCCEGIAAGSLGIAAVIATPERQIVSRGRNQLFDSEDSPNLVKNTIVSHAEINAIAGLSGDHRFDKSLVLYTTVEPCPMCMGAVSMSPVRSLVAASRDPYAGATDIGTGSEFIRTKNIRIAFESGDTERLFAALHVYSLLENRKLPADHRFFGYMQEAYPRVMDRILSADIRGAVASAIAGRDSKRLSSLFEPE